MTFRIIIIIIIIIIFIIIIINFIIIIIIIIHKYRNKALLHSNGLLWRQFE